MVIFCIWIYRPPSGFMLLYSDLLYNDRRFHRVLSMYVHDHLGSPCKFSRKTAEFKSYEPIPFQNVPLCYSMMTKGRLMMTSLVDFAGHYIYRDNNEDREYTEICSRHMDESMKRFLIKMAMMTFGYTIAITATLISIAILGVKSTTTEDKFPFIEAKSNTEFIANLWFQTVVGAHAGVGYVGIEMIMEIFTNVVTITPKLARFKLEKLIEEYEMGRITEDEVCAGIQPIEHFSVESEEYVLIMQPCLVALLSRSLTGT